MKEQFFYLEDQFGVKIAINDDYINRNNNHTLELVADRLGNTFICSSDNYFTENVFEPYVYEAYYAGVYVEGPTGEYCMECGPRNRIVSARPGGADSYIMFGHAYFDRAFSREFTRILAAEAPLPQTASKLWDDLLCEHLDTLEMAMRPYPEGVINEFDSLAELSGFDPDFINNVDSSILDNICRTLGCERADIADITPIKKGLTNLSFSFSCKDAFYVYRHPGAGTDAIIVREAEVFAEKVAADLGLDGTFVHEDPKRGWKITRYVENSRLLDYSHWNEVAQAIGMARTLHESGVRALWSFDLFQQALGLIDLLGDGHRASFKDFDDLFMLVEGLYAKVSRDGTPKCMCHNDFYSENLLLDGSGRMYLIDWEYAGMSDYASDLGNFVACSQYDYDEAVQVFKLYFGRELTDDELFHCVAYTAIVSFYWFVWALYQDECGNPVGEWQYLWYRHAKMYGARAVNLFMAKAS